MTFLERVFSGLEKIDSAVRTVVGTAERLRGTSDARAKDGTAVPDAPKEHTPAAATSRENDKPLGDPTIAVQLYGRITEPWTGRAKRLLEDRDVPFVFVELDDPKNERVAVRLETETRQHIVPYVYIRGKFVGGYNALDEIDRLGQLEEAIKTPEERARGGQRGVKIEIATRGPEDAAPGEKN